MNLVVGKPKFYSPKLVKEYLEDIIATNAWGNNGKYVSLVESHFKLPTVTTNNATTALELALQNMLADVPSGSYVAVPAYTFVASASAIVKNGFKPVFIDVGSDYCLDVIDLERKCRDYKIEAILPVHLFGNLCNIDYLECHFSKVLYDAAHCNGMSFRGNSLGNYGYGAIFSGHPTKLAGGFELGVYTSKKRAAVENVKVLRNFGLDPRTNLDCDVLSAGTNAKASEIAAASFLAQLRYIEEIKAHYSKVHRIYQSCLPEEFTLVTPNNPDSNHSYVVVQTREAVDEVIYFLREYGILARKYFTPLNETSYFLNYGQENSCPNSKKLYDKTFILPTGLHIDLNEILFICSTLKKAIK